MQNRIKTKKSICRKKGQVPDNVSYFHNQGIKDRIQKKAYRNRALSRIGILFKIISE
ncbi:MAG: hypothetical protein ACMUEL_03845 [Flavobacteriales bacterium Tduv]